MDSVHCSKHQLCCKSFEGIRGAGLNAAIAVTHFDVGCILPGCVNVLGSKAVAIILLEPQNTSCGPVHIAQN